MRILVTGAAGMLAAEIIKVLNKEGHEIIQDDINQRHEKIRKLDITDAEKISEQIKNNDLDYVFHLAAETNVDLCEKDPDHAFNVNVQGVENVAAACKEYNVKMLYISTAGVFRGDKKEPYTEEDPPQPINVYGDSKHQGELIVQKLLTEYFIIRAGWMVGGWEIDKKFVYKIIQQIMEGKKELRAVNDKFGSPTFTKDFAANLMNVINSGHYGLYHMTNKGTCSRYDIAVKIVEFLGMEGEVTVRPISSDEFPLPAPRADSEMMDNMRLNQLGLNNMPHWEDSLREYVLTNKDKLEKCVKKK